MFSYRHAFHAGNHADVLKHLTLVAVARYLMRKAAPMLLIDTHAGAGVYALDSEMAGTSGEAAAGFARLSSQCAGDARAEPSALLDYLALVRTFNPGSPGSLGRRNPSAATGGEKSHSSPISRPIAHAIDLQSGRKLGSFPTGFASTLPAAQVPGGAPTVYPGSPFILAHLMDTEERRRIHDRLKLFELHPSESQVLAGNVRQLRMGRRVTVEQADGFDALARLLPPAAAADGSRRALVLIDPPYEVKTDYARVGAALDAALRRFPTGVYLIWYPIIPRLEAHDLPRRLGTLARRYGRPWLQATLAIGATGTAASVGGTRPRHSDGLVASGVFIVNPPYVLADALHTALPEVDRMLARGSGHGWSVEQGGDR